MNPVQKLIKLIADAIAVGLVVSIIGGIATVIFAVGGITSLKNEIKEIKANEEFTLYQADESINKISLNLSTASLSLKQGDEFSVYYGEGFRIKDKNGVLYIEDTIKKMFDIASSHTVIVTVPKNKVFSNVNINSGAGSIYIEKLICDSFNLDSGVGTTEIDYIKVKSNAQIDGGVGALTIADGSVNNLDYSVGVGKADVTAKLMGKSEIESGIGDVKLCLTGGEKLYTLKGESGIGAIRVDGETLSDDSSLGTGANIVEIDGGIGTVRIDFAS